MSAPPTTHADLAKTLEAFGLKSQDAFASSAFARVLLLGPPKIGKSTALACTAPGPVLIIKCDLGSSLVFAAKEKGAKFEVAEAYTLGQWEKICRLVPKMVAVGGFKSVVVDSITMLGDSIVEGLKDQEFTGYDLWNELDMQLRGELKIMMRDLAAHVFLVAHLTPSYKTANSDSPGGHEDTTAGVLPLIPGQGKVKIPGLVDDIVLMTLSGGKREFVLDPQKSWEIGGRNMSRSVVIPADVGELLDELGISS